MVLDSPNSSINSSYQLSYLSRYLLSTSSLSPSCGALYIKNTLQFLFPPLMRPRSPDGTERNAESGTPTYPYQGRGASAFSASNHPRTPVPKPARNLVAFPVRRYIDERDAGETSLYRRKWIYGRSNNNN